METILYFVLGLASLCVLIGIIWRFSSRHLTLPCPVWLRWMVELNNPFTKTNRASVIISHLNLEPGMKVLDAGCGPGRLTIPIAKIVGPQGEVMAMDLQEGMLHRIQEKASQENFHNIRFLQAGIGEGKLDHSHFDRALLVTVLGEIPDRLSALKEIFQALKPSGILSITEVIFDPHFQRQGTVLRLASEAGFQMKTIIGNRIAFTMLFQKP